MKKNKKRILYWFLAFFMVIQVIGIYEKETKTGVSVNVQAAKTDKVSFVVENGVLTEYTGKSEKVTVPGSVTKIGECAFSNCKELKEVELPESLTEIGNWAFSKCKNLTEITLPKSVAYIGPGAFSKCKKLTKIKLPEGIVRIEDWTFYNCYRLQEIELPKNLERIGMQAFTGCLRLKNITLPKSLTSVGMFAFQCCENLKKIKLPDNLSGIEEGAFRGCVKIKNITVSKNNQSYTSVDGVLYTKDKKVLVCYPAGKKKTEYTVNPETTDISSFAFTYSKLKSIELPDNLESGCSGVFSDCKNLRNIVVTENNQNYTSVDGVLYTKDKESLIYYPKMREEAEYAVAEGTKHIKGKAFYGCNLENIQLPDSLTDIGIQAFSLCKNLKNITVTENNETYASEDGVLYTKNKETLLYYPAGKEEEEYTVNSETVNIEEYAFNSCRLKSIQLPSGLKKIGLCAFIGCSRLTDMILPKGLESIGSNAFSGCHLVSVEVPDGITNLGDAFDSSTLVAIAIPDSVTEINSDSGSDTAFSSVDEKFTVYCHKNSFAQKYAQDHNISYVLVNGNLGNGMRLLLQKAGYGHLKLKKNKMLMNKSQKSKIKIASNLVTEAVYQSLDKDIASVNGNGIVTGKKKGKTTVVVSANGVKKKVKVTVKDQMAVTLNKNMKLSKSKITMKKGTKLTIQKAAGIGKITFRSLNKKIASVSVKGLVKARKRGKTTILMKNKQKTVKLRITVKLMNKATVKKLELYKSKPAYTEQFNGQYTVLNYEKKDIDTNDYSLADTDHSYKVFLRSDINSWDEAEAYCETLGGHLATITSQEENDYVYSVVKESGYTNAYFGLTDQESEGTWHWVTEEEKDYVYSIMVRSEDIGDYFDLASQETEGNWHWVIEKDASYTNWHSGEPNAQNDVEDYAMFYSEFTDGTWNDGDFSGGAPRGEAAFICEWD